MKKELPPLLLLASLIWLAATYSPQARTEASSSPGTPSTRQVAHPHTRQQFITLARQDAQQVGISPDLFVRQIDEESGFDPTVVSPAGAVGIAQFMPETARGLGINPHDPIQSLRGAAQLMARYQQRYGGSYAMALAAYNAGSGRLQRAINDCGDSWQSCLPAETRAYIQIILRGD